MSEKDVSNGISLKIVEFWVSSINFYLLVLVICIFLFSLVPGHRTCEKTYTHTKQKDTQYSC